MFHINGPQNFSHFSPFSKEEKIVKYSFQQYCFHRSDFRPTLKSTSKIMRAKSTST